RPHVEEIEPLGGIAADDLLEETDPAARGRFLLSTLDDDGPTDLDAVPMARTEHAECRDDGNAGRARQHVRPDRERSLAPEERNRDVAARAEGAVALERDDVAPPERRDQLDAEARMRARHEAHAVAVATD